MHNEIKRKFLEAISEITSGRLFLYAFVFTCVIAFLVQFVVLPLGFLEWHAGHGLLIGLDSTRFHSLAVNVSNQIRSDGWDQWQLRPEGQAPAGLAAAIYAISFQEPWTLIPLNAALHALAVVLIWKIVLSIEPKKKIATLSILPVVFFLRLCSGMHRSTKTVLLLQGV